jgi:hypothetical protein
MDLGTNSIDPNKKALRAIEGLFYLRGVAFNFTI